MPHPSQMAHHSSFHQAMFCHHAFLIRFTHTDVRTRWVGMFTHTTGEQTTRSMVGGMVYAYAYMNIQIYTESIFGKYISYHIWYQISYHIIYIYHSISSNWFWKPSPTNNHLFSADEINQWHRVSALSIPTLKSPYPSVAKLLPRPSALGLTVHSNNMFSLVCCKNCS